MKSRLIFVFVLILVTSCNIFTPYEDTGSLSWASVDSIRRVWRTNPVSVTLECNISLPNPCYSHKNTNIEKSDSAWTIELESWTEGGTCFQMIHAEIITIDLQIPDNTEQRLLFLAFGEVNIDTVLNFE